MANAKISDLSAISTPASGDLIPLVDISDISQGSAGSTRKITYTNLTSGLTSGLASLTSAQSFITGVKTFGTAGAVGILKIAGSTSGSTILDAPAVAAGTITLPSSTSTLVGRATTDTLTNKDISDSTNTYRSSSLTVTGVVELATSTEINTGTDSTRAIPVDQFVASARNVRYILYRIVEATTDTATGTTKGGDFEVPFTGTITEVGAFVDTAGTTNLTTVDINKNGTTIMATNKVTIDSTEKSSRTAATAAALTVTAITAGDLITFDIDAVQTTAAKGLTVRIGIRQT